MARQKAETAGAAKKRTAQKSARGAAKTTRKTPAKAAAKTAGKTASKTAAKAGSTRGAAKSASRSPAKAAAKSGAARKIPTKRSPGISRVDQDSTRTHGWVVRLSYEQTSSGWRPKHTAYFGDATHGGAVKALAAAEEYLRKLQRSEKKAARA